MTSPEQTTEVAQSVQTAESVEPAQLEQRRDAFNDALAQVVTETVGRVLEEVVQWQGHALSTLKHMHAIPEGSEIEHPDGRTVSLTGDALMAFQAALEVSQAMLEEMPIQYAEATA